MTGQTLPTGAFVAIAAGAGHNYAMPARTLYSGDLLVDGPAHTLRSQLNRSITVAGAAHISTEMQLHKNPVMDVAGPLTLGPGAGIIGAGSILAQSLTGEVLMASEIRAIGNLTFGSADRPLVTDAVAAPECLPDPCSSLAVSPFIRISDLLYGTGLRPLC